MCVVKELDGVQTSYRGKSYTDDIYNIAKNIDVQW